MHEVKPGIIMIKKLVWAPFDPGDRYFYACIEGVFDHPAGSKAFQFSSNKSTSLAWFHVLEVDDREGVAVELDLEPVAEL